MIRLPRQYKRKIAAGESAILEKPGQYFYCPEADQLAFAVEIDDKSQMLASAGRGWQADLDDEDFSKLRIINTGGAELNLTIEIGFGRPLDQRLSLAGAVQVQGFAGGVPVSVSSEQALGQNTFITVVSVSAVAAEISKAQLYNPAASGKILLVDEVTPLSDADFVRFIYHDTGLLSLSSVTPSNVDRRGPASVAQPRLDTVAGLTAGDIMFARTAPTRVPYKLPSPIVLLEGQGLVCESRLVNFTTECTFFWREVPV